MPLVPRHAEQESDHFLNAILIMSPISFFGLFGLCLRGFGSCFPCFLPASTGTPKGGCLKVNYIWAFLGYLMRNLAKIGSNAWPLTASPAGYSPLQLTFSLFIQFHPPRVYHINQHSFHLFFPLPPRLCQGLKWSVPSQRIRENNAIRELMDDVYKRTTSNESQKWDLE